MFERQVVRAVCVFGLAVGPAGLGGTLELDSRIGAAEFLASDFSGLVIDSWATPAGLGSFMISGDATTPSLLTATVASMVFTYTPGVSISGGAAIDGFTFVPGGHTEGALVFDVFFTVDSSVSYTWDTVTFMDPDTSSFIELTGPGGLVAEGAGVFAPGTYRIMAVLDMDVDPPVGPAGFSTHYLFELTFPAPGGGATAFAALALLRRRRR